MTLHRAHVAPLRDTARRPLWTVLIPTWNCARYLEEALSGVLVQDPGRDLMQIIVVDDHSTLDDPEAVVRALGNGRVTFLRQESNVGKVRNYETGLSLSRGHLIHQLHGDDRVRPGFYATFERAFTEHPHAAAFFCDSAYIDARGHVTGRTGLERGAAGILDGFLDKIYVAQRIQSPSLVVRRGVYEQLGGFDRRLNAFEDWEMWIRIAASYPVGFLPAQLAEYRVSDMNATSLTLRDGSHVGTLRQMLEIVDAYLPSAVVRRNRRARNAALADYLTQMIGPLRSAGLTWAMLKLAFEALRFNATPRTLSRLLYFARGREKLVS